MKTISLMCHTCGKTISKPKNEINRQLKNGRTDLTMASMSTPPINYD